MFTTYEVQPIGRWFFWKDSQQAAIEATGIPPQNDLEAAILATLLPGSYTAIAAGKDGSMGVGLIEVYKLPSPQ